MIPENKPHSRRQRHRSHRPFRPASPINQSSQSPNQPSASPRKDVLRIIPLGGQEEIGRNCVVFEYGHDIVIVDMGLQWPEEDMPGIDYIIPNIQYLRGKEKNIRGICITHGHYDHIGAVPHIVDKIGNPPIYGGPLSLAFIRKRQEEYPNKPKLRLQVTRPNQTYRLGAFTVEFIPISHSIPDAMAVYLKTPGGSVVHTGDYKMDIGDGDANSPYIKRIEQLGRENVTMLMADSTNAPQPGRQLSEGEIKTDMEQIFRTTKGRMIVGMFASNIDRVRQVIELAEKYKRYVFVDGRSMKTNVEIARQLGYMKYPRNLLKDIMEEKKYPPGRSLILCTGAQGEERAALSRIVNREHKFVRIERGDTVIFSSSVIPGNERAVQRLADSLYREGADVINYRMMDIHAGGHGKQEDMKLLHRLVKPKYLMPIYAYFSFLHAHRKAAIEGGFPENNILIVDDGQVVEVTPTSAVITKQRVPTDYVFVDGLGVGDVSHVVLRDRQALAEDGMVVIIVQVDAKSGRLVGRPDITTRGFVYTKTSKKLLDSVIEKVKKVLTDHESRSPALEDEIKEKIRNSIGQYLFTKTERRPMILPVVIEV